MVATIGVMFAPIVSFSMNNSTITRKRTIVATK